MSVQDDINKATGGGAANLPNYSVVLWDGTKPYWRTPAGGKVYIAPAVAAQSDDARLKSWGASNQRPDGNFFTNSGTWDPQSGEWDQGTNWGNVLALGVGGAIAAPLVAGAVGAGSAAGAGTAASVAPNVASLTSSTIPADALNTATSAGSWLTSPIASLIGTGINSAGQIYGANKAADTSIQAAQIQAAEYDKALAAAKAEQDYQHSQDLLKTNQYNSYLTRLQPYAQTGQAADNRISQFMGQPPSAQTPLMPSQTPQPAPQPNVANAPAQTVMLIAPDGSQKAVPADQAQYYISKGAKPAQPQATM